MAFQAQIYARMLPASDLKKKKNYKHTCRSGCFSHTLTADAEDVILYVGGKKINQKRKKGEIDEAVDLTEV